jgi:hypothetical protein
MPRYRYVCESCESEQIKFHLSSETPKYFCNGCYEPSKMVRALTIPHIIKEHKEGPTKVGQLTKEYIESNKEILEQEKRKAQEETYDAP